MKNVQVIDSGVNCSYPVFEFTEDEFRELFPNPNQDVEFIEDVERRLGEQKMILLLRPVWSRRLRKPNVQGIHGTLFYQLEEKRKFYPLKRDDDIDMPPFGPVAGGCV